MMPPSMIMSTRLPKSSSMIRGSLRSSPSSSLTLVLMIGRAHLGDQGLADPVVGDPDAGGLPLGEDDLGNGAGGLEDEGVGPGEETFHDLVGVVGDPGVAADVLEVGADEAQRLLPVAALDLVNPLDPLLVEQIAPHPVDRVGRIDDDPPAAEDLHRLADQPHLGVLIVDGYQHIVPVRCREHTPDFHSGQFIRNRGDYQWKIFDMQDL